MKIVHIMSWYMPDMGYQENHLPAEQKKFGHDVEIITSDRFPDYRGFKQHIGRIHVNRIVGTGIFNENDVKIHRLPCLLEVKNSGQILLNGLKSKLKDLKPEIVQAHGTFNPLTLQTIYYSKKLGYKIFVDDHSNEVNFHLNSLSKKVYIELVKLFYHVYRRRVSCFMPVTYASEKKLRSLLNIPDEKVELLHLGADTNRFKKSSELRKIGRKDLGVRDNEFLIVSSGKFDESKDIHILIKAFAKVVEKSPNIQLLLVGNGPVEYMKKLKNLVDFNKLNNKVFFHDFVSNSALPKYYNAADIGVWPGYHSITVIGAVATGLPVIIPDNLAYKILTENNAAVVFERRNILSLSKQMESLLLDNTDKMSRMSSNAIKLSKDTLSWVAISKKSLEIYGCTK